LDWVISFLKNKDLIHRKIIDVSTQGQPYDARITYKDKTQVVMVLPTLDDFEALKQRLNDSHILIAALNNKDNLSFLLSHWKELVSFKNLCMYFINPFSTIDKKWIIFPYTHNRICDESSLRQGLTSLFEGVEAVSEEEIEEKIR
jgi:hypothetical protein